METFYLPLRLPALALSVDFIILTGDPEAVDTAGDVFLEDDDGSVVFKGSISTQDGNTNCFLGKV